MQVIQLLRYKRLQLSPPPASWPVTFWPWKWCPSHVKVKVKVHTLDVYAYMYASRLSRLLKVIGTDADRSATYDFILTFHINHGPISYRFRDKRRFQSKIVHFPTHMYLAPLLNGFPLKLGTRARSQKTRMMGLPGWERSLPISSAVWIQYTNITDRQTDRRTPDDSKDRTYA